MGAAASHRWVHTYCTIPAVHAQGVSWQLNKRHKLSYTDEVSLCFRCMFCIPPPPLVSTDRQGIAVWPPPGHSTRNQCGLTGPWPLDTPDIKHGHCRDDRHS